MLNVMSGLWVVFCKRLKKRQTFDCLFRYEMAALRKLFEGSVIFNRVD